MADWRGSVASFGARRIAIVVVLVLVLVAGVVVVNLGSDGDETMQVVTEDDPTSTTADETTTTSEATTTSTEAPTTTLAPTTTAPPVTAPPTTAAPPDLGTFDMAPVLEFARSHQSGATRPMASHGESLCPAGFARPWDTGDDTIKDIESWALRRYCKGIYELSITFSDDVGIHAEWIQIDVGAGGCGGVDFVVIAWLRGGPDNGGEVVSTPSCEIGTWRTVDAAAPVWWSNVHQTLQFRTAAIGDPEAFDFQVFLQGVGDPTVDAVPNGGPEHFIAR